MREMKKEKEEGFIISFRKISLDIQDGASSRRLGQMIREDERKRREDNANLTAKQFILKEYFSL